MNEGRSCAKDLELLESVDCGRTTEQRLGMVFKEGGEWCTDLAKMGDETVVKVGKAQETLKIFNGSRLGPIPDGLNLPLVYLDVVLVNDITKEIQSNSHF